MNKYRGQKFFPQLTALAEKLGHMAMTSRIHRDDNKLNRADEDIQARLDKQAAKLARRAKAAGHG